MWIAFWASETQHETDLPEHKNHLPTLCTFFLYHKSNLSIGSWTQNLCMFPAVSNTGVLGVEPLFGSSRPIVA